MVTRHGVPLVEAGGAEGAVLRLSEPLSFWGGVDPETGEIVDAHHPQKGEVVSGRVLVMDAGRGSSSASSVLAEMIRKGTAPAAILLAERDPILVVGAVVAAELYGHSIPVVHVSGDPEPDLRDGQRATVRADGTIETS